MRIIEDHPKEFSAKARGGVIFEADASGTRKSTEYAIEMLIEAAMPTLLPSGFKFSMQKQDSFGQPGQPVFYTNVDSGKGNNQPRR